MVADGIVVGDDVQFEVFIPERVTTKKVNYGIVSLKGLGEGQAMQRISLKG